MAVTYLRVKVPTRTNPEGLMAEPGQHKKAAINCGVVHPLTNQGILSKRRVGENPARSLLMDMEGDSENEEVSSV